MEVYMQPWMKFATVEGRASRREYWTFVLINMAVNVVLTILAKQVSLVGILGLLFSLALIVPSIAVGIRRLHDTGKSGWYLLAGLVPVIGWLAVLIFMLQESSGDNNYGVTPV